MAKLQKTQKDVDVLVEEAKIKAVEVEKKVAGADAFAEQVSKRKIYSYYSFPKPQASILQQSTVALHYKLSCAMLDSVSALHHSIR